MQNFEELLKKSIFETVKPEKVLDKLTALFEAFSLHKEVLLIVEDYCANILPKNARFDSSQKNNINKMVKKAWLAYWIENKIEKEDLPLIKKHFNSYTINQQEKLNTVIEKNCGREYVLKAKTKSIFTLALAEYRKGNAQSLEKLVDESGEIKKEQLGRIADVMSNDKLITNTLPIYVKAFEKCSTANFTPSISLEILLKQSPEHFISFTKLLDNRYKNMSNKSVEFLYNTLKLRFVSKANYTASVMYLLLSVSELDAIDMPNAFKNIDAAFHENNNFITHYVNKNFNITSSGVNILFDMMPYVAKNYGKYKVYCGYRDLSEFKEIIDNLQKIYSYTQLNDNLSNKDININNKRKI